MSAESWLNLLMGVLGGVGIFLLGMKFLSEGMQALAGPRLSRFVNDFTGNRFLALLAGILVTFVLQSSSATNVMVVGFVNSGLMALRSALGVSLGASVGTTLSLWVLTLNVTKFGLLVIGFSAFLYLFAKRVRPHNIGRALLGKYLNFYGTLTFTVIGGVIYYLVIVVVLWLRLNSNDLKLFTAVVVSLFLAVPYLRGQSKSSFARLKRKGVDSHA